jgi:hypothetical protein
MPWLALKHRYDGAWVLTSIVCLSLDIVVAVVAHEFPEQLVGTRHRMVLDTCRGPGALVGKHVRVCEKVGSVACVPLIL